MCFPAPTGLFNWTDPHHPRSLLCSQVVFLPGTAGNQGGPHGKDANMGLPAQMFSRNDPTAEQPVETQVGAGEGRARCLAG